MRRRNMIGSQKFDPARSCVVLVVTEAHDRTMMTNETKTTMGSRTGFPKTNDQHHVQVRAQQLFEETATLLFACLSYKRNSHNSHKYRSTTSKKRQQHSPIASTSFVISSLVKFLNHESFPHCPVRRWSIFEIFG